MEKTILIAVKEYRGYGDYLFALKLTAQLTKYYTTVYSDKAPSVYIVTNLEGKEKMQRLQGDVEFGVRVLSPLDLKVKIDSGLKVDAIISGPGLSSSIVRNEIDPLLIAEKRIPLIDVKEYGYREVLMPTQLVEDKKRFDEAHKHIIRHSSIYTGFNEAFQQKGILLSDELMGNLSDEQLLEKMEPKVRKLLMSTQSLK